MQLITSDISMFDPIKSKIIKAAEVKEQYDVAPEQMVTLQAPDGTTKKVPLSEVEYYQKKGAKVI